MWILVMLLTLGGNPQFNAFPPPLTQAQCEQAKSANELQFQQKLKDHPDAKVEFKCVRWDQ